ncbi:MAG: hypothetical protein ABL917_03625 [Parcubacteria group bacterium]
MTSRKKLFVSVLILLFLGVVLFGRWRIKESSKEQFFITAEQERLLGLPPDPGEAGKQTLVGIDSDKDGVRDDVQRWIGVEYSNSAESRAALLQHARAHQAFIASVAASTTSSKEVLAIINANTCLSSVFGPSSEAEKNIKLLETNTNARLEADLLTWKFATELPRTIPRQSEWKLLCN